MSISDREDVGKVSGAVPYLKDLRARIANAGYSQKPRWVLRFIDDEIANAAKSAAREHELESVLRAIIETTTEQVNGHDVYPQVAKGRGRDWSAAVTAAKSLLQPKP